MRKPMIKRTCEGCKAIELDGYESRCLLGYKYDHNKFIPLEFCPKPKTISQYVKLKSKNG